MNILECRLCKSGNLTDLASLGDCSFTGIFPAPGEAIGTGSLDLVSCQMCGLVQLKEDGDRAAYFGIGYGYESALNSQMISYLSGIFQRVSESFKTQSKETLSILDIGCNDGTFLDFFNGEDWSCFGIDPSASKFVDSYRERALNLQVGFFPEEMPSSWSERKFDLISAIAMFYDLPDPLNFLRAAKKALSNQGKILIDVGFVPRMIANYALDSICHEHLSYFSTRQLTWAFDEVGLRVAESWLSDMNGGTITVILEHRKDDRAHNFSKDVVDETEFYEVDPSKKWLECIDHIKKRASETKEVVKRFVSSGKQVAALGASTKGNTMLQLFDFGQKYFVGVGEVNADKFGRVTPGSELPIVSESELLEKGVDVFVILPWHFKDFFYSAHHLKSSTLILMMPNLTIRPPEITH